MSSLFLIAVFVSLCYVGYDFYMTKKKGRLDISESKVKIIWEDIKNADAKEWFIGFFLFMVVMFTMRGVVLLEHQAQTCDYWYEAGSEFIAGQVPVSDERALNRPDFGKADSYGDIRKVLFVENGGVKPVGLSINCSYDFKNFGRNVKEAYLTR